MAGNDPTDISVILTSLGVDENVATSLKNRMNGQDYLDLVNAVTTDSPQAMADAKQILSKYKIKLQRVTEMTDQRLEAAFYEMHTGKKWIDESELEWVRPITEMDSPVAAMSGYSNFVRAANDDDAQAIMDWLEENEFDYQNNDKHTFLVQCSDRENTYRLNHFVGGRNGKTAMMDALSESDQTLVQNLKNSGFKGKFGDIVSLSDGDIQVYGAKQNKFGWAIIGTDADGKVLEVPVLTANMGIKKVDEAMSKKHPPSGKIDFRRNPVAQAGRMKGGAGAHDSKDPRKRDAWDRNAKHKKSYMGESSFTQGETVQYGDREAPVHVPAGPNGTVGLLIDGKVKMVREDEITRVDEGVIGMTKIDPINRLAALAGIRNATTIVEDEFDATPAMDDFAVADDVDDPMGADLGGDAGSDVADLANDPIVSMDGGDSLDPMGNDLGSVEFANADMDADDMFGADDLGQPAGAMGVTATDSEAYTMIQDHLNEIQDSLGDVKLSEYRSLIAKLDALSMQIKSMGRDYLGETRRKK